MMNIMERIQETLGIGLKADIAPVQRGLKFLILGIEGIFPVSTQGITLQEEGMC